MKAQIILFAIIAMMRLSNGTVYVGGDFSSYIASNGSRIFVSAIGELLTSDILQLGDGVDLQKQVSAISYLPQAPRCDRNCSSTQACLVTCVPGSDPALFIGGSFTIANGAEMYRISRITNGSMLETDKGVSNTVYSVQAHETSGIVYYGGAFLDATGVPVGSVTSWDGKNWDQMGGGVSFPSTCDASGTQPVKARNIAMWDPAAANGEGRWSSLCDSNPPNRCDIDGVSYRGTSAQAASPVYVFSLAYHAASNMLYVGGLFQSAGQRYANINSLAAFSLTSKSWSIVGGGIAGPSPVVHALYISPGSQDLYVAGSFSAVGKQNSDVLSAGLNAGNIAVFSLTSGSWNTLNGGIPDADIRTVAVDGQTVYCGGKKLYTNQQSGVIGIYKGDWSLIRTVNPSLFPSSPLLRPRLG
ncbi:hypothetical protein GUITHDRAFT_162032 [Guillardia theta CCMP2712]|uniref:Rax2-like C-terminal domain-containing protein n=1 Tax=Guillardia theta (strain CCMP2712) TaxID=905079 RepID=L1JMU2_GUITC|nr:hypothetical protein GUITHDRAFT_162032 [Guillardia theta CCMP2712]EKX49515.1 hypothetical protein GUITHDRAFT_162032 [Guillardia theta CCMP2712]|eukprot:XP_005836495.1 hypothetical protein GUITHDRAFT_162032 [Guillardia theta CCMP2712]